MFSQKKFLQVLCLLAYIYKKRNPKKKITYGAKATGKQEKSQVIDYPKKVKTATFSQESLEG